MSLPERDRYQYSRNRILAQVAVLFGGRVAEEIFCNDISSGAANDIKRTTHIVRSMVREWGMSDDIGPISYADSEEKLFGGEVLVAHEYSEATAIAIDREVKRIISESMDRVRKLINDNREALVRIAEALIAREVLSAEEVDALIAGRQLPPPVLHEKPPKNIPDAVESTDEAAHDNETVPKKIRPQEA